MTQAGIIKAIRGNVSARTPDGQIRQLFAGDVIYENETIETGAGSEVIIELNDGRTLNLSENSQIAIDVTSVSFVAAQNAIVTDIQALQTALEEKEEIWDEEIAAGEQDEGYVYNLAYHAGHQLRGDVYSYLFEPGHGDENRQTIVDVAEKKHAYNPIYDGTDHLESEVDRSPFGPAYVEEDDDIPGLEDNYDSKSEATLFQDLEPHIDYGGGGEGGPTAGTGDIDGHILVGDEGSVDEDSLHLSATGNDKIYGSEDNDLIFGDVLNTDGVFNDLENSGYDLSTIENLPAGSGWEVFEKLQEANLDWTLKETTQYILENDEDLGKETVLRTGADDGDVRDGGHDYIEGGNGDDIIYGQEGNDIIDPGSGNDIVDGGSGIDTLIVTSETELDFSNVSNIERIYFNKDAVAQEITLSLNQVLSMTDEDKMLQITGEDEGDSVTLTGVASGEWTYDGHGLFTKFVDDINIQVTIETVNDGVDIDVNVDDGTTFSV